MSSYTNKKIQYNEIKRDLGLVIENFDIKKFSSKVTYKPLPKINEPAKILSVNNNIIMDKLKQEITELADKLDMKLNLDKSEEELVKILESLRKISKLSYIYPEKKIISKPKKTKKVLSQEHIEKMKQGKLNKKLMKLKQSQKNTLVLKNSAFKGYTKQYQYLPNEVEIEDLDLFLEHCKKLFVEQLKQEMAVLGGVKIFITYSGQFYREFISSTDIVVKYDYKTKYFASKAHTIHQLADLVNDDDVSEMMQEIKDEIAEFVNLGSMWIFDKNIECSMNIVKYEPIKGKSYIPLPTWIVKKGCVINVKNEDDRCFEYSCLAYLNPVSSHAERVSNYQEQKINTGGRPTKQKQLKKLNFDGIEFPVECTKKTIKKIEQLNPDFAFNVLTFNNDKKFSTLYNTSKKCQHVINLLYWNENEKHHYALIKDISALLRDTTHGHSKKYVCMFCLNCYTSQEVLNSHQLMGCSKFGQSTTLPVEGQNFCKFNAFAKQHFNPFVFYCDFESLTTPIDKDNKYQEHKPCSYQIFQVSQEPKYNVLYDRVLLDDPDMLAKKFIDDILLYSNNVTEIIKTNVPMQLTTEEENSFANAKTCYVCNNEFTTKDYKVRDHNHLNGNYRGAACNSCNLKLKTSKIPVVFHNLSGYDSHLIIKSYERAERISCIPQTSEKYISFSIGNLNFIDSLKFLNSSLESIVDSLTGMKDKKASRDVILGNIKNKFQHTLKHLNLDIKNNAEEILLLVQKGIYPYDYMNNFNKFMDTKLPSKEQFYSKLSEEDISDEDYERACTVWKTFNLSTMKDYHDLYLKLDILLLADCFENFRSLSMEIYKIDPTHYYTLPGLAWDAALRMTNSNLELFTDQDMYLFVEDGIRGGISTITHRHGKANNKYMKNYDKNKKSTYLAYNDANNLYGWSMSQYLPYDNYCWDNTTDWDIEKILSICDTSDVGYILNVDLRYPEHLHELHNDYPLAVESMETKVDDLSNYNKDCISKLKRKYTSSVKLVPNLKDKISYTLHYRNLKLYLQLGLELIKVNKVLKFNQKPWLKDYIQFNTNMRAKARSDFEKDFYKLMNNAVFGKTMENVRKRVDYKLVNDRQPLKFQTSKPLYKSHDIFNENLVGVSMTHSHVFLNKPIAIGFSILDLSKVLMYDFHYNTVKAKYGNKAKLLMTDTDSLFYEIETDDLYEDMKEYKDLLDTSDYPTDHPLFSLENKKVIGKFKDEANGHIIDEFVGIRSKMYAFSLNGKTKKRAKGIKKNYVATNITLENYKNCLFSNDVSGMQQTVSFNVIRSKLHTIYSEKVNKIGLCCIDDKRYILNDGISSYAYGHKNIPK